MERESKTRMIERKREKGARGEEGTGWGRERRERSNVIESWIYTA